MKLDSSSGILIKSTDHKLGLHEFTDNGKYYYYLYKGAGNDSFTETKLLSFTIFVLTKPKGTKLNVEGISSSINEGDCIQFEGTKANLKLTGLGIELLIAGTTVMSTYEKGISVTSSKDIYKVVKPWGHELWLNGQHELYAIKQIFIKSGTKTSLQYHKFKQETNVVFSGVIKLHYKNNAHISNNAVKESDIETEDFRPLTSIDVIPQTLHRIEALTDVLLYESSTPHLDDVVRVQDDNNRQSGRIETEHLK